MSELTHVDKFGRARMVDVSAKLSTAREAVAQGRVTMTAETRRRILAGDAPKGDVIGTARLAGVMAAKRTADLIPLCHPLALTSIHVEIEPHADQISFIISATVRTQSQTGVEMEALTAVTVAGLTLYDMAKALDRTMTISDVRLTRKTGGKSGDYEAPVA